METRVAVMTVAVLDLAKTCLSSLLFIVFKATCAGDDFYQVAEKNQHQTLGILMGSKSCYNAVQFFTSRDKC